MCVYLFTSMCVHAHREISIANAFFSATALSLKYMLLAPGSYRS